jgi:hypothetical protein
VVGEDDGGHGFRHGNEARQQAGVVATGGADRGGFAGARNSMLFASEAAGGFYGSSQQNGGSRGHAAEHATVSIGGDGHWWCLRIGRAGGAGDKVIIVLTAAKFAAAKSNAVFNCQYSGQAEEGFGEIGFEFVEDRITESWGNACGDDLRGASDGIEVSSHFINQGDHLWNDAVVGAANEIW